MFRTPRHRPARPAAGLLVLACVAFAGAQEPDRGTPPKEGDRRLAATLKEIINRGANLYNGGDHNGCYHLFVGALLALRPQLDGRPDLLKKIDDGLRDAEQHQLVGNRAWALYQLLLNVRESVAPETQKSRPTIREDRQPPLGEMPPEKKLPAPPAEKITPPKPVEKTLEVKQAEPAVAGKLTGVVTLNGKPVADADVRLIPADDLAAAGHKAVTDTDGTYEFLGLKPGRYVAVFKLGEKDGVLPPRYSEPKHTLLQINVKPGDNTRDWSLLAKDEELKKK